MYYGPRPLSPLSRREYFPHRITNYPTWHFSVSLHAACTRRPGFSTAKSFKVFTSDLKAVISDRTRAICFFFPTLIRAAVATKPLLFPSTTGYFVMYTRRIYFFFFSDFKECRYRKFSVDTSKNRAPEIQARPDLTYKDTVYAQSCTKINNYR